MGNGGLGSPKGLSGSAGGLGRPGGKSEVAAAAAAPGGRRKSDGMAPGGAAPGGGGGGAGAEVAGVLVEVGGGLESASANGEALVEERLEALVVVAAVAAGLLLVLGVLVEAVDDLESPFCFCWWL